MANPASPFLSVLILLLVAAVTAIAILVLSGWVLPLLKPNNPQAAKLRPYECGVQPQQEGARHRYSVKFYLTAMLFILFDVEAAFLLPWAVNYKEAIRAHASTFVPMLTFMATLLVGFIYAWGKGAFEWSGQMAELDINDAVMTTRLDAVVNWGRKNSLWPMPFGVACCAIEFMSMMASRFDLSRFGAEAMRFSPRQSDMMLILGTITNKMAPVLRTIYAQMAEPKWVISVGVCASSGGMYRTYATLQGVDRVIPVDVYVPGCPPRPESMIYGVMKLQEKIEKESLSMRKDHIARFYESLARQEALQAEKGLTSQQAIREMLMDAGERGVGTIF